MLVSVIIPTYNRFKFLLNAINSVVNQTFLQNRDNEIELFIINDCSTDPQYNQFNFKQFEKENLIIKYIKTSENSKKIVGNPSAGYTRNFGIKKAKGKYIAFLDDDDLWLPNKLEIQIERMEKENKGLSFTEAYIGRGIYNLDTKYKKMNQEYFRKTILRKLGLSDYPETFDKEILNKHNIMITSSTVIRKDIVEKIGLMSHRKFGEDYEYWKKAISHTNCIFIKDPLTFYDLGHGTGSIWKS
jgi:glycosyltransferase involved in cell wall biosynthesis